MNEMTEDQVFSSVCETARALEIKRKALLHAELQLAETQGKLQHLQQEVTSLETTLAEVKGEAQRRLRP